MSVNSQSIMERLRNETRGHHSHAEGSAYQQALSQGRLPRETYARGLEQLLLVHGCLEGALQEAMFKSQAVTGVVRDEQFQCGNLRADLRCLGGLVEGTEPLPATDRIRRAIRSAAADEPTALLGFHYVLEGSKNGGKFLAESVARSYGLDNGQGTAYLNPHGEQQRQLWQQFRTMMDGADLTDQQRDGIVQAACAMFEAITEIYDALYADQLQSLEASVHG